MSEIQRLPSVPNPNPVHPNAKSTSQMNNGTTTSKTNITSPICRNCKTQTTPLWRRDETGQVLCNACGLFLKLHGRPRPISLKTDTIKSRNRIKHPNFTKFSGPNTPELKSKDPKSSHEAVAHHLAPKTSPIPNTAKKSSPHDSPSDLLLSMGGYSSTTNTTPNVTTAVQSPLSHPSRAHYSGAVYNSQIQGQYSNLPPQVQSLHYPSSTPTQFAPGLQRITSPLLLSTTPSVSNARFSNSASSKLSPQNPLTAVQAAGALENMSNELGPSATFKSSASTPGSYSLMNSSKRSETSLSTPSSALKSAPTLPALGDTKKEPNVYASPSFGPQFHLQDGSHSNSPNGGSSGKTTPGPGGARDGPKVDLPKLEAGDHPKPSLPPLNNPGVSLATQLPQLSVGSGHSSPAPGAKEHVTPDGYMHSYDSQVSAHNSSHTGPQKQKSGPVGTHSQRITGTQNQGVAGAHEHGHSQAHTQNDQKQSSSGSHQNSHQNSNHGQSQTHTQGHTSNVNSTSNHGSSYMQGRSNQASNFSHSGNNNDEQDNNNKKNNGHESTPSSGQSYEVSALKTRISELELVNDLYRTRIMELEAMEQAARIRENSMRKRLDDLISESSAGKREGDHGEESAKRPKPN